MNCARDFAIFQVRKYTATTGIPAECLKEISTLKALSHPHVVRLSSVHREGASLSLLFDLPATATPLAHALSTPGRPALQRWTPQRLMLQLLSAVAYCHSHGVVHRSINPSTIVMLGDQGRLKLTGFSNLHIVGAGRGEALAVQPHEAYMSPEALFCALWPGRVLAAGTDQLALAPLYRASDIWAAACVLLDFLHTAGHEIAYDRSITDSEKMAQYETMAPPCGASCGPAIPPWTWPANREVWGPVASLGAAAVSFVEAIRQHNPTLRRSAMDILDHPFLAQQSPIGVDTTSLSCTQHCSTVAKPDFVADIPQDTAVDSANSPSTLTPVKICGLREADLSIRLLTERHEIRRMEVKTAASLSLPFCVGDAGRTAKRRPRNLIPSAAKVQKLV